MQLKYIVFTRLYTCDCMFLKKNRRVLVIGDLHFPYHRGEDTFSFLSAIKKKFKPDRVISIGDEVDYHGISFHNSDPDLLSPGHELEKAIACIKRLEDIFPSMDILESNHGSLVYRKAKATGLSSKFFKNYNEIYGVSQKWKWHFELTIKLSDGQHCYFHHGRSADVLKTSMSMGMSAVQGHYHEKMSINYWANTLGLYFAAQTGCLVDDNSLAMSYNNTNLKRPILGSLMIIDGQPKLVPMILNKRGRWIGEIL